MSSRGASFLWMRAFFQEVRVLKGLHNAHKAISMVSWREAIKAGAWAVFHVFQLSNYHFSRSILSSCAQEKMTIERFWSIFKKQHGAMVDSSSQNWDEFHKKYHTQAFHYSCDNEDYMLRNPDGYLQRKRLTGFINSSSSTNSPPSKGPTKHDPKMKIRWHLNLSSCFGCPAAPWVGFDMLYYSWNPWKESIWKISSACKTRFSNCSYMQHICSCLLPSTNSVDALDLTFQF